MNVFILAAGLGTRLKPLTNLYPKPVVPFLNVPMGLYNFRFFDQLKFDTCVVNTFHLHKQVEKLYSEQTYIKNNIQFSEETSQILGSAGGLKKASKFFSSDETILMMNADEIFFTNERAFLKKAYQQHIFKNNLATLVVMKHPEAGKKFGAIWTEGTKVQNIGKSVPETNLEPWHYIGIIFLNSKILSMIQKNRELNIFYDVLIYELNNNSVEIFPLDCNWYETGNAQDYLNATSSVLNKIDNKTFDFIKMHDPSRIIKNPTGVSLVSNHISLDESKLVGYNCISKTANKQVLKNIEKIENSIIFENEIINLKYFSL